MKKNLFLLLISLFLSVNIFAQEVEESEEPEQEEKEGFGGSAFVGGVSIDGKNYQQFGVRTDIPIFKLGLGVDIQLLLDENGQVRKEDWDEWTDYLDKLYYIRWAKKEDPLYFKFGGIDFTRIGFGNIVNGYSNMIQYPEVKRWGLEFSMYNKLFGVEVLINNFKELFENQAGMMAATRLSITPIGKLEIGASFATDLNEYNGLSDLDDDGYPDAIDLYPNNENLVTEYDYYLLDRKLPQDFLDQAVNYGVIDGTKQSDLIKYGDLTSMSYAYGLDIGYPIIESGNFDFTVYSHFTQLGGDSLYGWGITLPGVRIGLGKMLTFSAEYRRASDEFLYGYYNYTYELERSVFVRDPATGLQSVVTKQNRLLEVKESTNGFFVGVDINIQDLIIGGLHYSDMLSADSANFHIRSLKGELELTPKLLPKDASAKAYYIQNNVENFKEWKTPSTIMGYTLEYNFNGVNLGFDYRYTFQDLNGDGLIKGTDENVKTFGLKTAITF
jgi:hypothetical protein